ncbi:hypothetical protein PROFUN_08660 [Planoprotostelium fungivorum]|uniref:PIH1D1/2/3 CS-like domain-containing protein n=1 Tax=Planoprotostelium fungivorum TaxID=1890364 RepID=A0A2P6NJ45_9EUKA|nr:hypothetical protein PROFUN_08660 [Planoprotostelium fungivorum]
MSDDIKMTPEEQKKLFESFQNPEFRQLFMDYAKDLQNSDTKQDFDQQIKMIEQSLGHQPNLTTIDTKTKASSQPPSVQSKPKIQEITTTVKPTIKPEYEMEAIYGKEDIQAEDQAKSLKITVKLPQIASIAGIDLEVGPRQFVLESRVKHLLELRLPFEVEVDKVKAQFDKGLHILVVHLPRK